MEIILQDFQVEGNCLTERILEYQEFYSSLWPIRNKDISDRPIRNKDISDRPIRRWMIPFSILDTAEPSLRGHKKLHDIHRTFRAEPSGGEI